MLYIKLTHHKQLLLILFCFMILLAPVKTHADFFDLYKNDNKLDLDPESPEFSRLTLPRLIIADINEVLDEDDENDKKEYRLVLSLGEGFPFNLSQVSLVQENYGGVKSEANKSIAYFQDGYPLDIYIPRLALHIGDIVVQTEFLLDIRNLPTIKVDCLNYQFDINGGCGDNKPISVEWKKFDYYSDNKELHFDFDLISRLNYSYPASAVVFSIDNKKIQEFPADILISKSLTYSDLILQLDEALESGEHQFGMSVIHSDGISYIGDTMLFSVEVTCDSDNLHLCGSNDCDGAGGYWWTDDTCNDAPEQIAETLDSTTILGAWNYTGNRPDGVTRHGTMNFSSGNVFSYTLVDADNQSNGSGTGYWTLSGSTLTLDAALKGSAIVSGNPTTFNFSGHGTFVFTR